MRERKREEKRARKAVRERKGEREVSNFVAHQLSGPPQIFLMCY